MSFRVKASIQKLRPEGLHADCAKVRMLQAPTADTLVTVPTNGVSEGTPPHRITRDEKLLAGFP